MAKKRLKNLLKKCLVCGKNIKLIVYKDHTYRGGHYFGKIPLYKPYSYAEYWECPKCYWEK